LATVVDALIVTLGLDASGFKRGQQETQTALAKTRSDAVASASVTKEQEKKKREEEKKTRDAESRDEKEANARRKAAEESYKRLRNSVLGMLAAFAGVKSLKDFFANIISGDAATQRMAHNLGMTTEALSEWQGAAERTGGSAQATAASFDGLTQDFQQFALTGQSRVIPYFRALGIQITDAHGKIRPLSDILLDLSDKFSKMDPRQAMTFGRAMGLDDGTINLLEKGRAGVEALLAAQKRLGVESDADGKRAQALQNSWRDLQQAITSVGRTILNDLAPTLQKALDWADQWVQANRPEIAATITKWIFAFRDAVGRAFDYIRGLDWHAIWSAVGTDIKAAENMAVELFDYLQKNWPEIKQDVSDFAAGFAVVAKEIGHLAKVFDSFIKSHGGWKTAAEVFFAAWAIKRFAPIIGSLMTITRLLAGFGSRSGGLIGMATDGIEGLIGLAASPALLAAATFIAAMWPSSGGSKQEIDQEHGMERAAIKANPSLAVTGPMPDPAQDWWTTHAPTWLGGAPAIADTSMSAEQKAFLETLSQPESGGRYNVLNGGEIDNDLSHHPDRIGKGGTTTAFGRYQFTKATWDNEAKKLGLTDMSPANQDKAAWDLAVTRYKAGTHGRDLMADLKAGGFEDLIATTLRSTWTSLPTGSETHQTSDTFKAALAARLKAQNQPAEATSKAMPTPAPAQAAAQPRPASISAPASASAVPSRPSRIGTDLTDGIAKARAMLGLKSLPPLQPPAPAPGEPKPDSWSAMGKRLTGDIAGVRKWLGLKPLPPLQSPALPAGVRGLPMGAAAMATMRGQTNNTTTNHSTSEINVNGPITVQTPGGTAKDVARGLMGAIKNTSMVAQANTGLN
jgi:muramidase (phage lysozyme)